MIVLLDTSSSVCLLTLVDDSKQYEYSWEAGRGLAQGLLSYIRDMLDEHGQRLDDITGIGVMKGPGSFTGLRIGITVCNTIADTLHISIVGEKSGDGWQDRVLTRLRSGENEHVVTPEYGADANITTPRK